MRRFTSILILLWLAILVQGCGTGSFLGQRYDNFTAYYNTFYNAERVFEEGYDGIGQVDERVDRTEFLPVFVRPESGSRAREFESAIEKSADVLRDHPDSKWVDDALLLIGKSYFYRENYVGAIQKFREVTSLGTGREAEGRFWLARTLIISGAFAEAESELLAALAVEDLDRRWTARYRLALGELNVIEEDWEAAATELAAGLEDVKEDDLAARGWFTLGQVYEKLERYEEAADAYESVRKNSPTYELSYAAAYSANRVEGFYGDAEEALSNVRKMERDDKNLEYHSELRLLRAQILQRAGQDEEAFAIYSDLLYNPNRNITLNGLLGRVHYSLGELYRDVDGDYVLAAAHFDTARTNLRGSARQAVSAEGFSGRTRAPEAIQNLDDLSESFNAYSEVFAEVARLDSLLHLGTMPEDEFDERILELRRLRADELERQRKLLEERERNQQFNRQSTDNPFRNTNQGLPQGKSIPELDDLREGDGGAGFLGVEDAVRVQEGRVEFISRWGERPLVPNWRREAAISNVDVGRDQIALTEETGAGEGDASDELPEIDISAVPRDSSAQVKMRRDRALARYELGNTLFLGMERPDSAAVWYRKVIDEGDSTDVSQRALYALAEVQYSLGDTTSAMRLYRDILQRYPESDFSDSVRDRLGMERAEARSDSSAVAMAEYSTVFSRWDSSNSRLSSRRAFNEMLVIAGTWPESDAGARSLLAASEIHLEMAGADSARIFGVLPITIDDSVLVSIWPRKATELRSRIRADSARAASASEGAPPLRDISAAADSAADSAADPAAMAEQADSTLQTDRFAAPDLPEDRQLSVTADSVDATVVSATADSTNVSGRTDVPEKADRQLSVFGHVALSDSLVIIMEPPGAPGSAIRTTPGTRLMLVDEGGALMMTQRMSTLAAEIRIMDLIDAVERLHPRTPFATRARQTGDLLDEMLVVEVPADSAMADSAAAGPVAADSLMATYTDSLETGITPDSTQAASGVDGGVQPLRTRADSVAAAELSGKQRFMPRTPPPAAIDSTAIDSTATIDRIAVPDSTATTGMMAAPDSTARPDGAAQTDSTEMTLEVESRKDRVVRDRLDAERVDRDSIEPPDDRDERAGNPGAPGAEFADRQSLPELDIDRDALAEEGIRMSSSLRPLSEEERPIPSAVGWTLVMQSSRDIPTARLERRRLDTILGDDAQPLHILVHTQSEEPEVLVSWGLFDTREALEAAREEAGDSLPDDATLLVLTP